MSLAENVTETVKKNEEAMEQKGNYARLNAFYTKMKELGILQKQEYTIPPLDTTGRRVQELMCQTEC